jgi:hypothetical protein
MAKAPAKNTKKKSFKKKEKKHIPVGVMHVQATFNNTIITFTDPIGNVVSWSSSGSLGVRVASPPCGRCPPSVSKFAPFATRRRFPTTAAARRSAAASDVFVQFSPVLM